MDGRHVLAHSRHRRRRRLGGLKNEDARTTSARASSADRHGHQESYAPLAARTPRASGSCAGALASGDQLDRARETAPELLLQRHMEQAERFELARTALWAGVDRVESAIPGELGDRVLCRTVVAGD